MTVNGQVIITKEELDIPASFNIIDQEMEDEEEEDISGSSSSMEVEEQFAIVKNETFNSELPRDHAYTTHDGSIDGSFCNDMIHQIIEDTTRANKDSNPLSILAQYTIMLENVFDDGTNSQWSMLLKKMKMCLDLMKIESDIIAAATEKESVKITELQEDIELNKNLEVTTHDVPETANSTRNGLINEEQQTESEEMITLKKEMEKICSFSKKLQISTKTSIDELKSPDNVPEVREKFHLLLKESRKEYRLLLSEFKLFDARQRRENGIKIKEKLLGQIDTSESSATDSDYSEDGQILNPNRELQAVPSPLAPGTPVIVSSTKESDSEVVDDAGGVATPAADEKLADENPADVVEANIDVSKGGSDGDESSVDMEWDDEKQIEKLLDLSSLDTVRPQRSTLKKSRKSKKIKKPKKKLEKNGSENSFLSSSDNETQSSESEVSWAWDL